MNFLYYIKTAFKSLLKNKAYSFINILGLSFGLSLTIIILLFVKYELNYDSQFNQSGSLYRLTTKGQIGTEKVNDAITPLPLYDVVKKLPQTKSVTRFIPGISKLIKYKSSVFNESRFFFADYSFFNSFDLNIIKGSLKDFSKPKTVVITAETARKYFNSSNPINKTINRGDVDYTVIAVCESVPDASHFHFDFMASMSTIDQMYSGASTSLDEWKNNWLSLDCYTYVKITDGTDVSLFEKAINQKKDEQILKQLSQTKTGKSSRDERYSYNISLQPVQTIHLNSNLAFELEPASNPVQILIFISIAIFILLITSINFINITTAKPLKRIQESAIRETFGARRRHVIMQVITEAFIISTIATLLGLVLAELILPLFNNIFNLSLHISQIDGLKDIGIVILITFIVGVISGIYPAKFFSEIKLNSIFTNSYKIKRATLTIRGIIVTGHIFVILFLSILTAGIWWQTNFVQNADLGFNKNNLLILERGYTVKQNFDEFKRELKMVNGVRNVSSSMFLPGDEYYKMTFAFKGNQQSKNIAIPINHVDCDYLETMELKLRRGSFLNCNLRDSMGIILNSEALRKLNIKKPLSDHFEINNGKEASSWKVNIIGVVSDYNYEPLTKEMEPLGLMLRCNKSYFKYIIIKLENRNSSTTITAIQTLWNRYTDNEPMDSFFLKDRLNGMYKQDTRMLKAVSAFTLFSYFISVLGFISLASFIIEYKHKKISYLKTAGIPDVYILRDLLGSFSKHIITGISLSVPLAIVAVKMWLSSYAYSDTIPWWLYIIITVSVLIVGALSVIIQYYKTVVRSNRYHLFITK
jgi:putative ABC transport system permease protein